MRQATSHHCSTQSMLEKPTITPSVTVKWASMNWRWVIDASIMPPPVIRQYQCAVKMIGEKGAETILEDNRGSFRAECNEHCADGVVMEIFR